MAQETQLLKGVLEGCILKLINDDDAYGYLIVEKLRKSGFENIQEATVYPILTRLQKKGMLSFEKKTSEIGPPRKYYILTDEGENALLEFVEGYKKLRTNVENIFKEDVF